VGGVSRFKMSLRDLERSTGHAPGEELVEIEPEVEQHYEPALRVTPMSPVSEMQAYGQIDPSIPGRRGTAARVAALVLLVPLALTVLARLLALVL
jgi:hypothetical protein